MPVDDTPVPRIGWNYDSKANHQSLLTITSVANHLVVADSSSPGRRIILSTRVGNEKEGAIAKRPGDADSDDHVQ